MTEQQQESNAKCNNCNEDSRTKKIRSKRYTLQNIGIVISLVIAIGSFAISLLTYRLEISDRQVKLQVAVEELNDSPVNFIAFPEGDLEPFPATYGFLQTKLLVTINNQSSSKVTITEIHATPISEDPVTGDMTPFFTNGGNISTDFNNTFQVSTNSGISTIYLPITLEGREIINVIGTIGIPLDKESSSIIEQIFIEEQDEIILAMLKNKLLEKGITIDRSIVKQKNVNGTPQPFFDIIESPNLEYEIEVFTNMETRHSTKVFFKPKPIIGNRSKYELIIH